MIIMRLFVWALPGTSQAETIRHRRPILAPAGSHASKYDQEDRVKKEELEAALGSGPGTLDLAPIEQYLDALATELRLPDFAVSMCAIRFEEASPALLAILGRAADGEALTDDEATLLFRGLHILGGARTSAACQPLLRLLRRPQVDIEYLLGDAVSQTLPRIMAGVFDGDADALFDIIADHAIDEFVRESLWGAVTYLTWEGRIEGTRLAAFIARFHAERLAPAGDVAWFGWLTAIGLLGLRGLAPLGDAAWREGLILEGVRERSDLGRDLAEAEQAPEDPGRFKRAHLGYIEDVLEALQWVDYRDPDIDRVFKNKPISRGLYGVPVHNPMRHVGRNDPCPCGSGKKAKKCCLST
jgi:hypothetical protein